jgi:hypothetical protein
MPRCNEGNAFSDEHRHDGDNELVNRVLVKEDPMISPPPIIQMFLPACLRRRSAKARIDSASRFTFAPLSFMSLPCMGAGRRTDERGEMHLCTERDEFGQRRLTHREEPSSSTARQRAKCTCRDGSQRTCTLV